MILQIFNRFFVYHEGKGIGHKCSHTACAEPSPEAPHPLL